MKSAARVGQTQPDGLTVALQESLLAFLENTIALSYDTNINIRNVWEIIKKVSESAVKSKPLLYG